MKGALWLLSLLMLTNPSNVKAQGDFPPMPGPPPVNQPDCPTQLMGSANDIFYYAASTCQVGSATGYGQSTSNFSEILSCCAGTTCKPDCTVLPTVIFSNEKTVSAPACSLPGTTPAELSAKLAAVIAECEARVTYLDDLFVSGEIAGSNDEKTHKGRIRKWRNYLHNKFIPYLKNSADAVQTKVDHYCADVLPRGREHQQKWSHSTLKVANNRTQVIQNEKQQTLPSETAVTFEPHPASGASVTLTGYCRVTVSDLASGTEDVFFKTFIVNTPQGNFQIGIQVQNPGSGKTIDAAVLQDRHSYGHRIAITTNPGTPQEVTRPYLCSSYQDLMIAE